MSGVVYVAVLISAVICLVHEIRMYRKERKTNMELQVYQIDAWIEPDGSWTYNNTFPICKVSVNGEPTKRKILKALRDKELLPEPDKFKVSVDGYFTYDGIWSVQKRSNFMPVFDVVELG